MCLESNISVFLKSFLGLKHTNNETTLNTGKTDTGQAPMEPRWLSARKPLKQMAEYEKLFFLPLLQQLEQKLILNSSLAFQFSVVSCLSLLKRSEKASFRKQKALFSVISHQLIHHIFSCFPAGACERD